MKMRILALAAIGALSFTACKKSSKSDDTSIDINARVSQHSDDESRVSNEMNMVDNDVNTYVESSSFGRVEQVMAPPCDATVVFDSTATQRRMTITFNGSSCLGTHTRTGTIVVTAPRTQHWNDAGAVINETISTLKITRLSDNKSIIINGTRTVTNVSGGTWGAVLLGLRPSVAHTIDGSMTVTFDDNSQRQWNIARRRELSRTATQSLVLTVRGNHTENGMANIAEWGTNRFGNAFTSQITEPLRFNGDCSFRLGSGTVTHTGIGATTVVTFGLNASGDPQTTCPGANPYYFKAVWTGNGGNSATVIRPYF